VAVMPAPPQSTLTLLTSSDRVAIIPIDTVPRQGRTGESDRLVKANKGETVTRVTQVLPLAVAAGSGEGE
jgi:DNA gyrase subunit A